MSRLHHSVKFLTFPEYPLDRLRFDLFQRNEALCPLSLRGLCQHEVTEDDLLAVTCILGYILDFRRTSPATRVDFVVKT